VRGLALAGGALQRRLRGASVQLALVRVQARQVVGAGWRRVLAYAPRDVKRRERDDAAADHEDGQRLRRRARLRRESQRGNAQTTSV